MEKDFKPRIMIVEGRYYEDIQDHLLEGAVNILDEAGVSHELISVPVHLKYLRP